MTAATTGVDRDLLAQRIAHVNRVMRMHAGAVELIDVTGAGRVTVRFVAMCQGCPFRAVTMLGLITPALESVPGVTEVRADGVRVSEEAAARARATIGWLDGEQPWDL